MFVEEEQMSYFMIQLKGYSEDIFDDMMMQSDDKIIKMMLDIQLTINDGTRQKLIPREHGMN